MSKLPPTASLPSISEPPVRGTEKSPPAIIWYDLSSPLFVMLLSTFSGQNVPKGRLENSETVKGLGYDSIEEQ